MQAARVPGLVRIPRHLLHITLDDLPAPDRAALLPLLADMPAVPDASLSAQLIGNPKTTLKALAVLARHIGQGLRDHNLGLAHDRMRLHAERRKLIFLPADALASQVEAGDPRPAREAILFVVDASSAIEALLAQREAAGLASFVTAADACQSLAHWRATHL